MASVGIQPRYKGRREIAEFFRFVREIYPGFIFENFLLRMEAEEMAFAEYEFRVNSAVTGRPIHQLFFGFIEVRNGKIIRLREALNGFEIVRGLVRDVARDPQFLEAIDGPAPAYPHEP